MAIHFKVTVFLALNNKLLDVVTNRQKVDPRDFIKTAV